MILPFRSGPELRIFIGTQEISGIQRSYAQSPPGHLLALIGSGGYLEIACNMGRAADKIGFKAGEDLKVEVLVD